MGASRAVSVMHDAKFLNRVCRGALTGLALLFFQACGSSSTSVSSVTSPTSVNRCAITIRPVEGPLPADGGSAAIGVTAARECTWSASVDGAWLTLKSGNTGQGDGIVEFAASANPDPVMRRGAIVANGQRAEVSQAAGECSLSLAQSSASFNQSGGSGQVQVRASSGMCSWSAAADAEWVQIRNGAGQGNGVVNFDIPASTGPPRSATIDVSGQKFSIIQSEGCTYAIDPTSIAADPSGTTASIAIAATPSCPWTASSNAPWITISAGASGSGNGTVRFTVTANGGPSRSGTITAAGQTFAVQQGTGCSYSLSSSGQNVAAAGGSGSVNVSAGSGCSWTATSHATWLTVTSGASGSGNGSVNFTAAAHTGTSREGTLTIAGKSFVVTQGSGCSFTINPAAHTMPAAGGSVTVSVSSAASCAWTASSNAPWLTVVSGGNGSGPGSVRVDAPANIGAPRTGTVTIAGQTLTVTQESGCTFTVSPETIGAPAAGRSARIEVTGAPSCGWTASSAAGWITIASAPGGSGNGGIDLTIAANSGPGRNGTLLVAGRPVTVTQDSGCTITLTPPSTTVPAGGGPGTIAVSAAAGCTWIATSNAPWVTVTGGSPGSGNGNVAFNVLSNTTGAPRSGTITIGGAGFTINQQ
jgi:hypothetical protein